MLAYATKTPEFQLDDDEAEKLSKAMADLSRHYNVHISQKSLDWGKFLSALSAVYGPRIAAIAIAKKRAKTEQPQKPVASTNQQPMAQQPPIVKTAPYELPPELRTAVHGTA